MTGAVVASKSLFLCPSQVPGSAALVCTVNARDKFGNPSDSSAYFSMKVTRLGSRVKQFGRVAGTESTGIFTVASPTFAPLSAEINLEVYVTHEHQPLSGPNPVNVTISPVTVSAANSSVVCPSKEVMAGSVVLCTIFARDPANLLVGSNNLESAFQASVLNVGTTPLTTVNFME